MGIINLFLLMDVNVSSIKYLFNLEIATYLYFALYIDFFQSHSLFIEYGAQCASKFLLSSYVYRQTLDMNSFTKMEKKRDDVRFCFKIKWKRDIGITVLFLAEWKSLWMCTKNIVTQKVMWQELPNHLLVRPKNDQNFSYIS